MKIELKKAIVSVMAVSLLTGGLAAPSLGVQAAKD